MIREGNIFPNTDCKQAQNNVWSCIQLILQEVPQSIKNDQRAPREAPRKFVESLSLPSLLLRRADQSCTGLPRALQSQPELSRSPLMLSSSELFKKDKKACTKQIISSRIIENFKGRTETKTRTHTYIWADVYPPTLFEGFQICLQFLGYFLTDSMNFQ